MTSDLKSDEANIEAKKIVEEKFSKKENPSDEQIIDAA